MLARCPGDSISTRCASSTSCATARFSPRPRKGLFLFWRCNPTGALVFLVGHAFCGQGCDRISLSEHQHVNLSVFVLELNGQLVEVGTSRLVRRQKDSERV